jgi:hypothetical protein
MRLLGGTSEEAMLLDHLVNRHNVCCLFFLFTLQPSILWASSLWVASNSLSLTNTRTMTMLGLDGTLTVQHGGEHGHALLGKGERGIRWTL